MSTYANGTKSSSSFGNGTKASSTFKQFLRHGKDPGMDALANYTFTEVVFDTGEVLQNLTFEQLADIVYTNLTKH